MGTVRYSKWVGRLGGDLSLEDLLEQLADYLLHSGFHYPYHDPKEGRSPQELYAAILQALAEQGQIDGRDLARWLESPEFREQSEVSDLLKALLQRLTEEGYITLGRPGAVEDDLDIRGYVGGFGPETKQARFEITNKTLDFLGYKTLRDLFGAPGKSDCARHDTRELSTGIEAALPPKPYEFGDSLNLDVTATLLNAIERQGLFGAGRDPAPPPARAGRRLARQILTRERKDMRQIVMIPDGKPAALPLADVRTYKNPAGLDPR